MFSGGKVYFRGWQRVTLNPEKQAGAGMGWLPGDLEMPAYKAVWSAGGDGFFGISGITAHLLFLAQRGLSTAANRNIPANAEFIG